MRRLMRIDLSSSSVREEDIPSDVAESFVGGRGFGARYVYDEIPANTDPLGPQNKLLIGTGPLAGTSAQSLSKWAAYTRSPLTGTYTRSSGGGDFGAWLKWAGLELLIIEGRAATPVYLHIKDGKCEIRDAGAIWGKSTVDTQVLLKKTHGAKARMICIGPAAEKSVRYAGIFSDRRAAGRGGTGTVMGSKNLKAVVVEAERSENLAQPDEFKKLVRQQVKGYKEAMGFEPFRDYGTPMGVDMGNAMGYFPVRNFREGVLEGSENISFAQYAAITKKHTGCFACMLKCGKVRTVASGPYQGATSDGPHYETIWAFTGSIGCSDLGATVVADNLCCELGLDTISTGVSIGFAYELFEKGILTAKDTDGLVLKYGDPEPMLRLIEMIGAREGLGDILAEGVKRAADRIGKGSEEYAMHVKGQELPGYEPRAMKALGMNYALSNVGANHCFGYAQQEMGNPRPRVLDPVAEEDKGDVVKYNHDYTAAIELAGACTFPGNSLECFGLDILAKLLVATLGVPRFGSEDYLWHVAEKTYNLERCFNVREGFSRKDDTLPKRMLTEPLRGGMHDGEVFKKPDTIIDEYYGERGWDRDGIPTAATLARLGLEDIDRDIAPFRS